MVEDSLYDMRNSTGLQIPVKSAVDVQWGTLKAPEEKPPAPAKVFQVTQIMPEGATPSAEPVKSKLTPKQAALAKYMESQTRPSGEAPSAGSEQAVPTSAAVTSGQGKRFTMTWLDTTNANNGKKTSALYLVTSDVDAHGDTEEYEKKGQAIPIQMNARGTKALPVLDDQGNVVKGQIMLMGSSTQVLKSNLTPQETQESLDALTKDSSAGYKILPRKNESGSFDVVKRPVVQLDSESGATLAVKPVTSAPSSDEAFAVAPAASSKNVSARPDKMPVSIYKSLTSAGSMPQAAPQVTIADALAYRAAAEERAVLSQQPAPELIVVDPVAVKSDAKDKKAKLPGELYDFVPLAGAASGTAPAADEGVAPVSGYLVPHGTKLKGDEVPGSAIQVSYVGDDRSKVVIADGRFTKTAIDLEAAPAKKGPAKGQPEAPMTARLAVGGSPVVLAEIANAGAVVRDDNAPPIAKISEEAGAKIETMQVIDPSTLLKKENNIPQYAVRPESVGGDNRTTEIPLFTIRDDKAFGQAGWSSSGYVSGPEGKFVYTETHSGPQLSMKPALVPAGSFIKLRDAVAYGIAARTLRSELGVKADDGDTRSVPDDVVEFSKDFAKDWLEKTDKDGVTRKDRMLEAKSVIKDQMVEEKGNIKKNADNALMAQVLQAGDSGKAKTEEEQKADMKKFAGNNLADVKITDAEAMSVVMQKKKDPADLRPRVNADGEQVPVMTLEESFKKDYLEAFKARFGDVDEVTANRNAVNSEPAGRIEGFQFFENKKDLSSGHSYVLPTWGERAAYKPQYQDASQAANRVNPFTIFTKDVRLNMGQVLDAKRVPGIVEAWLDVHKGETTEMAMARGVKYKYVDPKDGLEKEGTMAAYVLYDKYKVSEGDNGSADVGPGEAVGVGRMAGEYKNPDAPKSAQVLQKYTATITYQNKDKETVDKEVDVRYDETVPHAVARAKLADMQDDKYAVVDNTVTDSSGGRYTVGSDGVVGNKVARSYDVVVLGRHIKAADTETVADAAQRYGLSAAVGDSYTASDDKGREFQVSSDKVLGEVAREKNIGPAYAVMVGDKLLNLKPHDGVSDEVTRNNLPLVLNEDTFRRDVVQYNNAAIVPMVPNALRTGSGTVSWTATTAYEYRPQVLADERQYRLDLAQRRNNQDDYRYYSSSNVATILPGVAGFVEMGYSGFNPASQERIKENISLFDSFFGSVIPDLIHRNTGPTTKVLIDNKQ